MARLPFPITIRMSVMPEPTASSTTYWMVGVSTIGSISLGCDLVAGRKRVPNPAAGMTALRTFFMEKCDRPDQGRIWGLNHAHAQGRRGPAAVFRTSASSS